MRQALRIEPIATTFGDEHPRMGRVRLDLLSQPVNVGLERVRGDRGIIAPDFVEEYLPRHGATAGAIQELQDRGFLLGQPDTTVADGFLQHLGGGAEDVGADQENGVLAVLEDTQLSAEPRQQFGQAERLGDIVVGPQSSPRTTSAS